MAFSVGDGGDDAPMSDINVTPLVDVMLVLLIVFMITMPVLTHSVQINLPVTNKQQKSESKIDIKPIEISVNISGKYTIGAESTQLLDLDAVKQHLQDIAKQDPQTVVVIDADKAVDYDHVIKVLEITRDAGLHKVGFRMEIQNNK